MSSKVKLPTAAGGESALLPKRRFPEFRNGGGWKLEPMRTAYTFGGNNSLSRDKLNYASGSVKNIHYGDVHTKFSTHFDITKEQVPFINEAELGSIRENSFCTEGDLIFADASEDLADIGKCMEIVNLNGERIVSGLHTILARPNEGRIARGFGGHLFRSSLVRRQIQKEAQGAKVQGISAKRLQNLLLALPTSLPEQQKIAEVLGAVDEEIEKTDAIIATTEKLKRGLMQRLFFFKGRRYEKKIHQIAQVFGGKRLPMGYDFSPEKTEHPYIRVIDFKDSSINQIALKYISNETSKKIKKYIITKEDIYISIAGTVGRVGIIPAELDGANLTENAARIVLKEKSDLVRDYIMYFLNSEAGRRQIISATVTTTQPKLALNKIEQFFIPFNSKKVDLRKTIFILKYLDKKIMVNQKIKERMAVFKNCFTKDLLNGKRIIL